MSDQNQDPVLHSIRDAARIIGIQQRQLREAVNDGLVPHYKLRNSIILVSVPEVLSIMKTQRKEQNHDEYL
jgi:septum formation inhibitor-activating ATPase MinD